MSLQFRPMTSFLYLLNQNLDLSNCVSEYCHEENARDRRFLKEFVSIEYITGMRLLSLKSFSLIVESLSGTDCISLSAHRYSIYALHGGL